MMFQTPMQTQMYQMNCPQVSYIQQPTIVQPMMMQQVQPMAMQTMPIYQTATTMITGGIGAARPFYRQNQNVFCPNCKSTFVTKVKYQPGKATWMMCLGLGVLLGPFSLYVLCIEDCKDCDHYCSVCGSYLGKVEYKLCDDT